MESVKELYPLFEPYTKIMAKEAALNPSCQYFSSRPSDIFFAARQIQQVALSSYVSRGYNDRYGLSREKVAYESVSAHTNLVMALVDLAISLDCDRFCWLSPTGRWNQTVDGYAHNVVMEVIRKHDLPEVKIGDWPDNGARDEAEKARLEGEYYQEFDQYYPEYEREFRSQVSALLYQMNQKSSPTGRLIYAADKTAAIIAALTSDSLGHRPMISIHNPSASARDKEEMALCDFSENDFYKASEMWTIDHFHIRHLNQYDDTGFFTALIVMYTLMINGRWYNWREQDYEEALNPPP